MHKGIVAVLLILTLAFALFSLQTFQRFYSDDAFISLRYARNWLAGAGLAWNPGERVEGYTDFLHVLLVSGLGALGIDLVLATRLVGLGSFVLLNLFMAWYLREEMRGVGAPNGLLPLLLTLPSLPLIVWCWGGLETVLFTLLSTAGLWLALPRAGAPPRWLLSGALLGLAAMTRPEGVFFFALAGLFLLYNTLRQKTPVGPLLRFGLAFALLYLPYFVWRLAYYGDLLPNTFYVRTTPLADRAQCGVAYIARFALYTSYTLVLPLTVLLLVYCAWKRRWDAQLSFLLLLLLSYLLYVVAIGGDHMLAFRFMVPILPTQALLLSLALRQALPTPTPRQQLGEAGLFVLLVALQVTAPFPEIWLSQHMDASSFTGTIVGNYIAAHWPEGSLIALNTAGSTPYYAPRHRFLDMLGVNDAHIARRSVGSGSLPGQRIASHAKGDGAYVLSRQPDYIILGPATGASAAAPVYFLSDRELLQSAEFAQHYQLRQVEIDISSVADHEHYQGLAAGVSTLTYFQRTH